jgi:hypothetical protein
MCISRMCHHGNQTIPPNRPMQNRYDQAAWANDEEAGTSDNTGSVYTGACEIGK